VPVDAEAIGQENYFSLFPAPTDFRTVGQRLTAAACAAKARLAVIDARLAAGGADEEEEEKEKEGAAEGAAGGVDAARRALPGALAATREPPPPRADAAPRRWT
jgi:hypothetical protein